MSDRVEERRQAELHEQKRLQQEKTTKEKEASAAKFKAAFAQRLGAEVKNDAQKREQQGQKQFNQNLLLSKNGIMNRSLAERLVKRQDDGARADKELASARENDLRADAQRSDQETQENREDALHEAQRFDAPLQREEHTEERGQDAQGQQQQGQSSGQGQERGGQQHKEHDRGDTTAGALGAARTGDTRKIAIGKTLRAATAERISTSLVQGLVDKVALMATQGMQEFQIQLKDETLGGGVLRVTLGKDKKLQIAFTLKDPSAKNLLEASKGVLMRMFERKGLALASLSVKVRGED